MNRSAALDTMLFWPSQGSRDIMPHSHTVSKIPWGPQLPLPTNECFCSLHSRMHAKSSFLRGCSSPFYPLEMLSSVRIGMLEEHVFMIEDHRRGYQNPTISRASLLESHRYVLGEQRCRSLTFESAGRGIDRSEPSSFLHFSRVLFEDYYLPFVSGCDRVWEVLIK